MPCGADGSGAWEAVRALLAVLALCLVACDPEPVVKIAWVGDSVSANGTGGHPGATPDGFQNRVARARPDLSHVNLSCPGLTAWAWSPLAPPVWYWCATPFRFPPPTLPLWNDLVAPEIGPGVLVVTFLGTNDAVRVRDGLQSLDAYALELEAIATAGLEAGSSVLVILPPHTVDAWRIPIITEQNALARDSVCRWPHVTCLDLTEALCPRHYHPDDPIHPNELGHAEIAEAVLMALEGYAPDGSG